MAVPAALVAALALGGSPVVNAQQPDGYGAFLDTVEVRVVNVDVIVTDKSGVFVPGLTREDFVLKVDGKPVELSNFAAYPSAEEVPAAGETAPAAVAAPEAWTLTPEKPAAAAGKSPPAVYAVMVDQTLIQSGERVSILKQLRTFIGNGLKDGDKVLVATYNRQFRLMTDLTADRTVVDAALGELERGTAATASVGGREATILRDINRVNPSDITAPIEAERLFDEIQTLEREALQESLGAVGGLAYLSDALAGIEGRKALIYAGGGFSTHPVARLYSAWGQRLGSMAPGRVAPGQAGLGPVEAEIDRRQKNLIQHAGAHRVTLYTIAAGGVQGSTVLSPEIGNDDGVLSSTGTQADLSRAGDLRYIATETGGLALQISPQLVQALDKVAADFSHYYSLGFTPERGTQYHRVEVEVRQPGLRVRSRGGFRDASPGARANDNAIAALLFNATENPFEASAAAGAAKKDGKNAEMLVPVTVKVPLGHITLLPQGDHHEGKLSFDFAARDQSGQVLVMERRELPFSVPNDKLAAALRQYVSFNVEMRLRPGPYRVGVVVHDDLGLAASSLTLQTEVVEAQ
jgi:VWFA-related protein